MTGPVCDVLEVQGTRWAFKTSINPLIPDLPLADVDASRVPAMGCSWENLLLT